MSKRRFAMALWIAFGLTPAWSAAASTLPHSLLPSAGFSTLAGKRETLAAYRGRKLLVWEVATWCGSCIAGLQAMARHVDDIHAAGVTVILLQIYRNGGYSGMSMKQLVGRYAPALLKAPGWVIGTADKHFEHLYNPQHYADIYYLIDANGRVASINAAPAATYATIRKFLAAKQHKQ